MKLENIQKITDRDYQLIQELIKELEIPRTLEELLKKFDRLFAYLDKRAARIRLIGIERDHGEAEFISDNKNEADITNEKAVSKKQIQLYVVKKHVFLRLTEEEKMEIITTLEYFVALFNQLKAAFEIVDSEKNIMSRFDHLYRFQVFNSDTTLS